MLWLGRAVCGGGFEFAHRLGLGNMGRLCMPHFGVRLMMGS